MFTDSNLYWANPFSKRYTNNPLTTWGSSIAADDSFLYINGKVDPHIEIFPNPITGVSVIRFLEFNDLENAAFYVCDITGKIIQKYTLQAVQPEINIFANEFTNGFYIGVLKTTNGKGAIIKIIVIN